MTQADEQRALDNALAKAILRMLFASEDLMVDWSMTHPLLYIEFDLQRKASGARAHPLMVQPWRIVSKLSIKGLIQFVAGRDEQPPLAHFCMLTAVGWLQVVSGLSEDVLSSAECIRERDMVVFGG